MSIERRVFDEDHGAYCYDSLGGVEIPGEYPFFHKSIGSTKMGGDSQLGQIESSIVEKTLVCDGVPFLYFVRHRGNMFVRLRACTPLSWAVSRWIW